MDIDRKWKTYKSGVFGTIVWGCMQVGSINYGGKMGVAGSACDALFLIVVEKFDLLCLFEIKGV